MLTLIPSRFPGKPTSFLVVPAVLTLLTAPPLTGQEAGAEGAAPDPPGTEETEADPALETYFIANAAYNRKLYPVAIGQFEEFLREHPDHPKADLARRGLALSQYALKQYDKAMPHFAALLAREELDQSITRDRIVMMYGQCLLRTGAKDGAKTLFLAEVDRLQEESYRTAARAAICDISFGMSAWDEVLPWTAKLLAGKTDPNQTARGLYQQGYAHYQLKNPEAAITSLGKIEALETEALWKTRSAYLLGECHNALKQFDKAEAAFVSALPGLNGEDAIECRYRLGRTRFVLRNHLKAAPDFESYLSSAPDGRHAREAQLYLARCHLESGDFEKAKKAFEQLSGGDDASAARANLWWARVFTLQEEKDYDRAAELLATACGRFGESGVGDALNFDYANALMGRATPDWKTALSILERLEKQASFGPMAEVVSQLAVCRHKLQDFAGSLATNERFLAAFSDHPLAGDARFMRAENLFLLNRLDEAAAAFGTFLSSDDGHANHFAAVYRVAQIHHEQGRWDECLATSAPLLDKKNEGGFYAHLPFMVGDCLFRQEKWSEAIGPLEEFLATRVKEGPDDKGTVRMDANVDTALMQLAVACDRTGKQDQALKFLAILIDNYVESSPHLPLALAEQGRLAYEGDNLQLARQALERFVAEDKKGEAVFKKNAPAQRSRVMYYLAWIEATEGQHDSAAARFGEVVRLGDNPKLVPDAALQQGIALVHAGDFAAAAKHFPAMLQRYPKHEKLARVVYYTGLALARQKDWNNAAKQFKRVTVAFPQSEFADQAVYEWAWCERSTKREPEAIKLYEQLLAKYPASPLVAKVQSELAELQLDSGEQDKVITRLTETLSKVTDDKLREDIRYQLASAWFKKGDHETAAGQFERLLADYPDSKLRSSMLFQAGESRLKLHETVAARNHFAAAAAIKGIPANLAESVTMRLAETQALTGQHPEAAETYRLFLARFPQSRWTRNARFGLAFAMENAGDSQGAISEYKTLVSGKPVDLWTVRSHFQTGECLFNLQKFDQSIAEFVKIEITYKKYPAWQAKSILEIGRVLLAQERNDQAAERFKEVIKRYGEEKAAVVARQYLDELRAQ